MEHETLQRRSTATIKNMGVNSYSQIISAFRAQGDLTEDQLNILPVLQNTLGISRERHTAEIKRALYDEQLSAIATGLNSSSDTANWEIEADYNCPTIVHRNPNTKYVQLAEHVLQITPPSSIIQHQPSLTKAKLNHDLKQLVNDEKRQDGIINATQQQHQTHMNPNIKPNFNNIDINGSKVVRLVRAKQATKRKTSLDTLIEVVQKELLRVNGQTNSISPSSSPPSHMRSFSSSKLQNRILQSNSNPHRSLISSVLPSSHPASLTSQSNHSFKITRKRGTMNFNHTKRSFSLQQRNQSFNNDEDDHGFMDNHDLEDISTGPENIEEIVRDTVDKLVAITSLNTAPYVVNMLTTIPNNGNVAESKVSTNMTTVYNTSTIKPQGTMSKSDYYQNDHTLLSSTNNDLRYSMQQTSPMKLQSSSFQQQQQQQQQIHHSQLIIQPATSAPISTLQGTTTPTLFVAPRILNFQTVVPKPTTNIQIGNTKIILVSPSNITQHLPHSTTPIPTSTTSVIQQQSPVKLVKFTSTNNNINNTNTLTTRSTTLPINTAQTSTLTLPKNVQIVIPSQSPSTIQLTRTHNDDLNKSLPTTPTTFRPVTTVPVTLTTCTVDQIPQAAQEVTVTTSPTSSPSLLTTTSDLQQQTSLASIADNANSSLTVQQQQQPSSMLNITTTRTSPTNDEMIKSVAVNFQQQQPQQIQRPPSTHGPMIYRMTSVNPNVPVFRVRATTAPTSTTVLNKSIKTEPKAISVATTSNMCYEPKPTHNTSTASGSVSVLACFKTTKKRNKERAIMPRPSATDLNDTSNDLQQQQQRSLTSANNNTSLILNSDISNSNSSSDYRQQTSSTPTCLVQQTSLSSTLSDDIPSNMLSLSSQEQPNDTTTSSSNSIPISRNDNNEFNSIKTITTPNVSPSTSPLHSTPKLIIEDKSIQYVDHNNTKEQNQMEIVTATDAELKKRSSQDDSWIIIADSLLHDILAQDMFHSLDDDCQQNLSAEFNLIQMNLTNGILSSKDELINSIFDIKRKSFNQNLSEDNLEKLFQYFEIEFSKRCDETNKSKRFRPE
ncbi:hypothetical protein I4U23_007581 [Adineta vaga]|nr:hypothetical protein I4U23_007581 [Adineta vaga]